MRKQSRRHRADRLVGSVLFSRCQRVKKVAQRSRLGLAERETPGATTPEAIRRIALSPNPRLNPALNLHPYRYLRLNLNRLGINPSEHPLFWRAHEIRDQHRLASGIAQYFTVSTATKTEISHEAVDRKGLLIEIVFVDQTNSGRDYDRGNPNGIASLLLYLLFLLFLLSPTPRG